MTDENREVLHLLLDAYNAAAWDRLDDLVLPAYTHHNNARSLDLLQFKRGAAWLRDAIPDFRLEVADEVADGDRIAIRFIGHGTHAGSLFGEAPTHNELALHGQAFYRFEDGKVAEDWELMDEGDMRRQVGLAEG